MSKRRTEIELINDVLDIVNKSQEINKTGIVYGANLNFERASRIIKLLTQKGLIESRSNTYKITNNGESVLGEISKLYTLFK